MSLSNWSNESNAPRARVDVRDALDERDYLDAHLFYLLFDDWDDGDELPTIDATPLRVSFLELARVR